MPVEPDPAAVAGTGEQNALPIQGGVIILPVEPDPAAAERQGKDSALQTRSLIITK